MLFNTVLHRTCAVVLNNFEYKHETALWIQTQCDNSVSLPLVHNAERSLAYAQLTSYYSCKISNMTEQNRKIQKDK